MSADDAKEYGFIDGITEEVRMAAHFDLSRFKNVPVELTTAMEKMLDPERPLLDSIRDKIAKMNMAVTKK